jgi:hypothetical protein
MSTPSMGNEGEGDQGDQGGGRRPEPPPDYYDGIEFETFFRSRDPDAETRNQ